MKLKIAGIYKTHYDIESPEIVQSIDEPLGLGYILAIAQEKGHEVDIFFPKNKHDIEKILNFNPDIALYSCTTNRINFTIAINSTLKKKNEKLISIIGGYHASAMSDVARHFDLVVIGEGEKTFEELLQCFENNCVRTKDLKKVKGIAFIENNELTITPRRERINDLDKFPFPYRTEKVFSQPSNYLAYPPVSKRRTAFIEYSRGCPFNCSFCASPQVLGRKIVYKSPSKIIDELKQLKEKFGINYVFFTDLNMTVNSKKVEALCEALINADLRVYWNLMSGFAGMTKDLIEKMAKAKCVKITWGIENVYEPEWIKKETNKLPSIETMKQILDFAAKKGIMNEGSIMIGWPYETKQDIEKVIELLPEFNLHIIRPSIYTPLPGTLDYEIMKDKIEKNWDKFDTNHLVFKHEHFSDREIRKMQKEILKAFYSSPIYEQRISKFVEEHPKYKTCFDEFLELISKTILYP